MIRMSAEEAVKSTESTTDGKEAIALLKKQLVALEEIAEGFFGEVQDKEREWVFLTEALVAKIFGIESPQHHRRTDWDFIQEVHRPEEAAGGRGRRL